MVTARRMGLFILAGAVVLGLALPASAQKVVRLSLPTFRSFQWKPGTELSYAIKDSTGKRIGTAYYKVVKASPEYGAGLWELRYMAQGPNLSESSVVVFDPDQLVPLRTTRKIVAAGETTYWIVDYLPNRIVVTRRQGDQVRRFAYPKSGPVYDYEQVMFLLPLAEPRPDVRYYLPLYHTGDRGVLMTYWNPVGEEVVVSGGKAWRAKKLSYQVGMVTQYLWLAEINGRTEVVKYDTGVGTIFVALDLPGNTEVPPGYKEEPLQLKPPLEIKVKKPGGKEEVVTPSPPGIGPVKKPPQEAGETPSQGGPTGKALPTPGVGPLPVIGLQASPSSKQPSRQAVQGKPAKASPPKLSSPAPKPSIPVPRIGPMVELGEPAPEEASSGSAHAEPGGREPKNAAEATVPKGGKVRLSVPKVVMPVLRIGPLPVLKEAGKGEEAEEGKEGKEAGAKEKEEDSAGREG